MLRKAQLLIDQARIEADRITRESEQEAAAILQGGRAACQRCHCGGGKESFRYT